MNQLYTTLPVLLTCALSLFFLLRDRQMHPHSADMQQDSAPQTGVETSLLVYSGIMIVLTVGLSLMFPVWYPENMLVDNLRSLTLLAVIWPLAYIDFKTYRIPNVFILFGLGCRALLLVFELLFQTEYAKYTLISSGIAAGAMLVASILCMVIAKGSLGAGDVKLFCVIGLYLGMQGTWGAVFTSLLIALAIAIVLLATKKKGRKDAIPFAPAIVLGTYISVCLTGM